MISPVYCVVSGEKGDKKWMTFVFENYSIDFTVTIQMR